MLYVISSSKYSMQSYLLNIEMYLFNNINCENEDFIVVFNTQYFFINLNEHNILYRIFQ